MERVQLWQTAGYIHICEVNKTKKGAVAYHWNIHTLTLRFLSGHCTVQEFGSLIKAQLDISWLWDFDSVSLRKLVQTHKRVHKLKQCRKRKAGIWKWNSWGDDAHCPFWGSIFSFHPCQLIYFLLPYIQPQLPGQPSNYVQVPFWESGIPDSCEPFTNLVNISIGSMELAFHAAKVKYCLTPTWQIHILV